MHANYSNADQFIERHVFRHASKVFKGHITKLPNLEGDTVKRLRASYQVERKNDLRRHGRTPLAATVQLSWTDGGNQKFVTARILDVSEAGMRVEMREPM